MNHIYRLVWSQVRRTWLVVSELARGRGKAGRTSTPSRARSVWWAALPLSLPMLALAAAPAGITAIDAALPAAAIVTARAVLAPTVIAPVVSSAHPTGGQVTAGSGRIDYGDHLTTIQQNSQNLSLNWLSFNIGAQDTVNFLQPNAQAIAVNRIADPNGSVILGRLNANGQVFLINPNGVLFGKGAQVNVGSLVASTLDVSDSELGRGTLHFAGAGGGSVTNRGTLTAAPGGYVALLGHAVSNQGAIHAPAGSVALAGGSAVTLSFDGNHLLDMQIDASTLNALAENRQLIVTDGGQVLMSAGAKDSLLASVVNNTGTIQARTVENRAGKIVLLGGMAAGTTRVDGTLDASAPDGGDGGFIETSAAQVQVADATKITTLAAAGNAGTWLIDPADFTIAVSGGDITGATLSSQLGGGNVTIQSTDGSAGTQGNINVNDTVSWNANTLTLNALNNINVNAAMNASGTAGLALAYGQANPAAGNTSTYNVNAPINLADTGSFSTTLGNDGAAIDYTIITGLGDSSNLGAADLLMMGNSGYYVLGADIDASATAGWSGGFAPVLGFTGTFDGLGHTITGLTINRPGQSQVGLFGLTQAGSIVRNVGMVGGAITGNGLVGNLVGDNHATISHVYATGTVTDVSAPNSLGAAGGLVGSNSGTITDAYATGAVTSGGYAVGGLVGFNLGTITNAYATGATSSGTSGASGGGLVGVSPGTITHGYWDTDTASQAATAGVTGLTTQQLIASLPAGFDPAIWGNGDNQTTPYMLGWAGNQVFTRNDLPDATGARLYTVVLGLDHLQAMQANLGGRYVLGNAIDASDTSGLNGGTGFVPLGTDGAGNVLNGGDGFTGTFDGLGYAISGLSIDRTNRVGLFGYAGNGSILRNVRLLGGAMTGSDYVGGLVGQEVGGTITSSYATNVVTGNDFVGGLAGSSSGTITDAYATGAVAGKIHVGGLVGENDGGTIDNAYATNVVTGSSIVGGLVGSSSNGTITDAYATGAVTGNESFHGGYVGGLVGQGDGDTITNVHATGVVIGYDNYVGGLIGGNTGTITNAYATGSVTGSVGDVGGLIGNNAGTITNTHATGTVKGYGYVGGLIGNNTGAITNAHAIGAATGYGSYVGGLIGGNTGAITSAYATGAATAGYYYVGGLIGSNTGAVASVYATGAAIGGTNPTSSFAGATDYVGGLIGSNAGMVNNAYATGAATAVDDYVGGLMGSNDGVVTNVYATGAVTGKSQVGGLVGGNGRGGAIYFAYATGNVSGESQVGGLVGFNDGSTGGTVGNSYWDTTTTAQPEGCGDASCGSGATAYATTAMMQLASFASWGANIDAQGGTGSVWRIYEGHTAPLLRSFLTPHTAFAQPDFDGSGAALANVASGNITVPSDAQILGSVFGGDTLTLAGLTAGGGYTATSNANLSGLYSTQQGYDLIGNASRIISTPGSAAGEVRLDNGASWSSGTLAIATAGNINIMGALSGDALRLNSGGAITDTHALNVASFVLGGGNWQQLGATLPAFSATDFSPVGGSFMRALGGDGSSGNPYQLTDVYGLQGVGTLLSNSFTLSNDIDASGTTDWNGGVGFAPIGDSTTAFTGTFDGLGHTISNLTIDRPSTNFVGLFGITGTGSAIRNLGLLGGRVTGNANVGGLVGMNFGTIGQAYATGAVTGSTEVGGLVGYTSGGTITNAYATGAVSGTGTGIVSVGGLVGVNQSSTITNAYATGTVNSTYYAGGLAGQNHGSITNTYATGNVSGGRPVGNLVGFNDGTVTTSYWDTTTTTRTDGCSDDTSCGGGATGHTTAELMQLATFASWGTDIDAQGGTGSVWRIYEGHTAPLLRSFLTPHTAFAQPDFDGSGAALANIASSNITVPTDAQILGSVFGGDTLTLAGLTAGGGYTATSNADLSGLYSTQQGYDLIGNASRIISTPGSAASEVRLDNGASWSSGTLAIATAGNINIAGAFNGDALRLNGGGAITDTRALNVASFVLGGGNWQQLGATLPAFNATDFSLAGGSFVRALGGDGSSGNPWQLTDLYGLQGMGTRLSDSFTLSNNIDANATASWNGGSGFAPIGDSTTQFTGIFDGLGHTISGLTINRPTQDNVGLFGSVDGTVLRNIGLVGGSVSGADYVGGLVGQVSSGNISNAYATGTVSSNNYIGGLVGYFSGTGSLSQSYATGNVSGVAAGSSYIGGLAGYLDGGGATPPSLLNVSDVYATGNVSVSVSVSTNYIGGLAGYSAANINNAYATGDINLAYGSYIGSLVGNNNGGVLEYVHATGNINISSYGQYVGGLAGSNGNQYGYAHITYAYATGNISAGVGSAGGADYVGGLVGQNSAFIDNAYATGNLVADPDGGLMWAGGLVGRNGGGNGKAGVIANAYATGNVDGGLLGMYLGGLAGQNYGLPGPSTISNAYSTGHVSGTPGDRSGGSVGENNGYPLQSVYWNTETSGQSSAGVGTGSAVGLTSVQMLQVGSFGGFNSPPFSCSGSCNAGISATGGTGVVWRIYEGHTTPLLSVFLTPYTVNAQPDFDGSGAALANIASVTVPTDPRILGSVFGGNTLTLAGLTAGGGYTATSNANLSGLYSMQQGYDLIGTASRTISTPGSAAGEVRLDNGASWSSGTLAIATAGNINIMGALNGDALRLNSGGTITDTHALNLASFVLGGGNWQQTGSLPAFSATNFSLAGGSFVRALGGDGTSGNPWQLTDVYGLQGIGTRLSDSFSLSNDIDASGTTGWHAGTGFGFVPIGNSTTAFTGSFDGLGHTISALSIFQPNASYVGLFGFTGSGSAIRNVGLLDGRVFGQAFVGALVGYNDNGTITQAYATGVVDTLNDYIGGLVGYNDGSISQAYATAAVSGRSDVGGLVGYIGTHGTVTQAYATGAVSGSGDTGGLVGSIGTHGTVTQAYATGAVSVDHLAGSAGGLVGYNDGSINQAYATGAVNGVSGYSAGGLVGYNAHNGAISQAYATGAVTGSDYVGGLVGFNFGTASQTYATGAVSGSFDVGGLAGTSNNTITNSYWDMETTGQATSTGAGFVSSAGAVGLTSAQMLDPASFAGWDIATAGGSTSVWRIYAGHTAPLLRAFMTSLALSGDDVSLIYNGSAQTSSSFSYGPLTPGFWLPSANVDASLTLGSVGTTMGARNVGAYTLDLGPYSGQMGYDIAYTAGTLTITPATLSLSAVGDNKTYDGTTDSAGMVTFGGLLAGDSLAGLTQSFASKNVLGTNASTLGVDAGYVLDDGNGGGNYIIATHTAAGTITPYGVDLGGSRVYDGSTDVNAGDLVLGTLVGNETLTLSGTGSMADKNVGNGKSFALGTLTLSDGTGDAANYILAGGNDTVDISKRAIMVDATGADKVYDGTTADAVKLASTGLLVGDTVNFSGTGAFGDKNVGVAKAVGVSGIVAAGADAGNYSFNTTANTTADISQLGITVDATGVDKVYDGSTAATIVALGSTGLVVGDVVTFNNASAAFDDKNAGTGKTITVNGIAASGADAGNYSFNTTANTTANISQLGITVDATGTNRVYDGTTADAVKLASTGLLVGDTVLFSGTGAFGDKNVGVAKAVGVSGIVATGADASNYSFNTTAHTTANITAKAITVDATGVDKVYDGNTVATIAALKTTGLVAGDAVTFDNASATFDDKNAGTGKTVTVSGIDATGADAGNYSFNTTANTTADISRLGITVDATGANKVYDGNTADAVALASAGVLSGDTVNFTGTGSFADKNVGIAKAVDVSGIAASGADAANYSFNITANTTADITAKTITVGATGVDKVYNGSTDATITALGTTGLVAGDVVTFGNASAVFDNKNAGTGKTVTVSGIAATGADAGNYSFNTTANTAADISQLGITVDATGNNKVYDGSTADTVALASAGVLSGDTVNFTGTGNFADKNVGIGKAVSVSGIAASGDDAGNYRYNTTTGTTADITPATLTYRADAAFFFIGQIPGGLGGAVTGLVGGDTLADAADGMPTWSTSATSASPAGAYAIDGSGLSARNYVFAQAPGNALALRLSNGSAPLAVSSVVAGLQQDETAQGGVPATLHATDVRIFDGGVRLP